MDTHYPTKKYRLKLQDRSVRFEAQATVGDHNEWVRTRTGYYSKMSINDKDQICGLTR